MREQITEKSRLSMEQKKSDDLYNKKAVEMDLRTVELSISDAETRKDINFAIAEYNKALVSLIPVLYIRTYRVTHQL